jgi:hypothetical protein
MEWTSKAGTTTTAEFVGLDGEAVVLKRDGKEITVKFADLTPASVAQAKEMAARKTEGTRLDELDLSGIKQGWGAPKARAAVEGAPLRVAGVTFKRGVGTHAHSVWTLQLAGKATEFRAKVGVQEYPSNPGVGSVEFIVRGDGRELWRSGVMRGKDSAKETRVKLTGVKELTLEVTDGGDGGSSDHADWLDAAIIHDGAPLPLAAAPASQPSARPGAFIHRPDALPGKPTVDSGNPTAGKLRDLIIPNVNFENITLEEACEFFEVRAFELSADKKRLRIEVEKTESPPPMIDSLRLAAVPIGVALAYVAEKARMRLLVEADRVRFVAAKPGVADGAKAADFTNLNAAPVDPDTIVIPGVSVEDITLGEMIDFVRMRSQELSPPLHRGINIVSFAHVGAIRIRSVREKNITVKALLETIAKATRTRVVFGGPAVEFRP